MKRMKKLVAWVLMAAMILTQNPFVYAVEEGTPGTEQTQEGTGQVRVSIGRVLLLHKSVTFNVELLDQNSVSMGTRYVTMNADESAQQESLFADYEKLAPGQYTLKISSTGFATYTQQLTVASQGVEVKVNTGFLAGKTYDEQTPHPGVLLIGEVTGDGVIDDSDKAALVDAIDAGTGAEEAPVMDLNGDGSVDLLDLDYFTNGYKEHRDITATPETFIPTSLIQIQADEKTIVEGDLSVLTKNEGSVALKPAQEGDISEQNPVSLSLDVAAEGETAEIDGIVIETVKENAITDATIEVTYVEDGEDKTITVPVHTEAMALTETNAVATIDGNGNIQLDLGGKIAVKKVTLTITGTKNNNLAEISQVEFVNGMEDRIPDPVTDIPEGMGLEAGSAEFTVTWDPCTNVTGYDVKIQCGDQIEVVDVVTNSLTVTSFGGDKLLNYTTYTVSVQSKNGTWRSGFCAPQDVTPKPKGKPEPPDNVVATGKYRGIAVSWKAMKDTVSYNVYYKESSAQYYTVANSEPITGNTYTITELEANKDYTVMVKGVNEYGESDGSIPSSARTLDINPAVVPQYKLINRGGPQTDDCHIISATHTGEMMESPLDADQSAKSAWGTIDKNASSYYLKRIWNDGGFWNLGNNGLFFEFDKEYKMDTIRIQQTTPGDTGIFYCRMNYWDAKGNKGEVAEFHPSQMKDSEGRLYYLLKLDTPITAQKIQIGLGRYQATSDGTIAVSEVYFYDYDPLMEEIMGLYTDDLHTVLKKEVDQTTIDELRKKINTPEAISNECSPELDAMERELQTAEKILRDEKLQPSVEIHSGITTKDENRGFGGLNAWQPLGVIGAAGESITVYVGHSRLKTGADSGLTLVATQYHAESNALVREVQNLKVGANTVNIPRIWTTDKESGGALYVQYRGDTSTKDRFAVRVSGGVSVPVLDLYQVTDPAVKLEKATAYVEALETYVSQMPANHEKYHKGSANAYVNKYDYEKENCILGASDVMLDTMMLSLPAQQILSSAGEGTAQQKAEQIVKGAEAMEKMMDLFYQHKGLNRNAKEARDRYPDRHLNIRYQRMFSGAFMYASGNHIGIEYPETAGIFSCKGVVTDELGRYVSGNYFGWGIAHEIGHDINQGTYSIAEITNNYFAVLAQANETNDGVRFKYDEVYKKVTSNTKGRASNVFTQLGMYWQLHLAYDNGYNYMTYDDPETQLKNLFFARVDTYARDVKKAPAPGNIPLTLAGNVEQDLMRLACAAAEKNILPFFERWGKTPDEGTILYASQFAAETRAIYYVNDEARVYRLENSGSSLNTDGTTEAVADTAKATVDADNANQVNFQLAAKDNIPAEDILGYEITRCITSGGTVEKQVVGFTTSDTYSDVVATINNRVVTYEVAVVDKYLNRSAAKVLDPIKIEHDGSLDKTYWTVHNKVDENDDKEEATLVPVSTPEPQKGTKDDPCDPVPTDPLTETIDNKVSTVYTASVKGEEGNIFVEFNQTEEITGFKYTAGASDPIGEYTVSVKDENGEWAQVDAGTLGGSKTVYFANDDQKYVSTYGTDSVKLTVKAAQGDVISIAELDFLGVTGDNVDFIRTEDVNTTIGRLGSAFQYGDKEEDVIPEGSIVFAGSYKGNPAYNVVILYDQDGNIVGGIDSEGALKAYQIVMADVPENGDIQDVANGTWIYWIEPDEIDGAGLEEITKVRAELYRVNNAQTNEGQRLVSDSLFADMPAFAELPDITLKSSSAAALETASNEIAVVSYGTAKLRQAAYQAGGVSAVTLNKTDYENMAELGAVLNGAAASSSVQLSLQGDANADGVLEFVFDEGVSAKVTEYRYQKDTGLLNIYIAGASGLFADNTETKLGNVKLAIGSAEEEVAMSVTAAENAVRTVTGRTLKTLEGLSCPDAVSLSVRPKEDPVTPPDAVTGVEAKDGTGKNVDLQLSELGDADIAAPLQTEDGLKAALGEADVSGLELEEAVELIAKNKPETPLTLTFTVPGVEMGETDVYVLQFKNGAWTKLDASVTADDTVVVTVDSLDPVAFVMGAFRWGDTDSDGKITVRDALCALRHVVGTITLSTRQWKAANVDGQGDVSVYDALLILKHVAGALNKFPVELPPE